MTTSGRPGFWNTWAADKREGRCRRMLFRQNATGPAADLSPFHSCKRLIDSSGLSHTREGTHSLRTQAAAGLRGPSPGTHLPASSLGLEFPGHSPLEAGLGALPLHPWSAMGAADPGAMALRPAARGHLDPVLKGDDGRWPPRGVKGQQMAGRPGAPRTPASTHGCLPSPGHGASGLSRVTDKKHTQAVHTHTHSHSHMQTYTNTWANRHAYPHPHIHMCTSAFMFTYTHVCSHLCTHACPCVTHTCVHTCIHMHPCAYTHLGPVKTVLHPERQRT